MCEQETRTNSNAVTELPTKVKRLAYVRRIKSKYKNALCSLNQVLNGLMRNEAVGNEQSHFITKQALREKLQGYNEDRLNQWLQVRDCQVGAGSTQALSARARVMGPA